MGPQDVAFSNSRDTIRSAASLIDAQRIQVGVAVSALFFAVALLADPDSLKWVDDLASQAHSLVRSTKERELAVRQASIVLKSARSAPIGNANLMERGPLGTSIYKQHKSRDQKQKAISACEKELASAEAQLKKPLVSVPWIDKAHVGSAGDLWQEKLLVVQVVNERESIVEISLLSPMRETPGQPQKASTPQSLLIWLEADTTGWADGDTVDFTQPILITGTRRYETAVGGEKTILVARPWTSEELNRFNKWKPQKTSQ